MELILLEDVENLGFKDDLVRVKNGYGRNCLIPKRMAVLATPSAKKVLSENLRQRKKKEKVLVEEAKNKAEAIKKIDIKIISKAGKDGKLFGSVNPANLSDVLEKQSLIVDKKFINITGGAVKRVGRYSATLRLHREVNIEVVFEVIPDISKKG